MSYTLRPSLIEEQRCLREVRDENIFLNKPPEQVAGNLDQCDDYEAAAQLMSVFDLLGEDAQPSHITDIASAAIFFGHNKAVDYLKRYCEEKAVQHLVDKQPVSIRQRVLEFAGLAKPPIDYRVEAEIEERYATAAAWIELARQDFASFAPRQQG